MMNRLTGTLWKLWRFTLCLAVFLITAGMTVSATPWQGWHEHPDGAHEWAIEYETPATCDEPGVIGYYCKLCGAQEEYSTPPTGHVYGDWIVSEYPTCEHIGFHHRFCQKCGEIYQESLMMTDHTYGAWVTDWAATCVYPGQQHRTCQVCGATQTEEIPLTGHSFGDWTTDWASTCTSYGQMSRTCWVCGAVETSYLPLQDHSWGDWFTVVEATGRSAGTRRRTCQICYAHDEVVYFPAGTLRQGDYGEAVTKLQQALNDAGYNCGAADGSFGPNTESAVIAFEKAHNFPEDGIAWPDLQAILYGGPGTSQDTQKAALTLFLIPTTPELATYEVGSFVSYDMAVQNTTGEDLKEWTINSSFTTPVHSPEGNGVALAMGDSCDVITQIHTITEQELTQGYAILKWSATGVTVSGKEAASEEIEYNLPVGPAAWKDPSLSISFQIQETDGVKIAYTPGADGLINPITYSVKVTNNGSVPLNFSRMRLFRGVQDMDGIFCLTVRDGGVLLNPGQSYDGTFTYSPDAHYQTPGGVSEIYNGLIEVTFEAYGEDPGTGAVICSSGVKGFTYRLL